MTARHWTVAYAMLLLVRGVLLAADAGEATSLTVAIGDPAAERASGVSLGSFGKPERKGGRVCRNSDETGLGDGKAGYASVGVPFRVGAGLYEVRMTVWGESDAFSFVAHNGERYRTVGWGRPSGKAEWEEIRFPLRPEQLRRDSPVQRLGFASRDRQVWVARLSFADLVRSRHNPQALARARTAHPKALVIAASGATDLHIAVPKGSDKVVRAGASELQRYMHEMSNAYLPLAEGPTNGPAIELRVDREAAGHPEGYVVRVGVGGARITGGSPLGVAYGVYAFLEHLGCRWVVPGPEGEVVPERDPLTAANVDMREAPDFNIRWVGRGEWALKNRCNVNLEVAGEPVGYVWKWSFHTFYPLLPPDSFWESHPEYYPLCGRQRRRPEGFHSTQICTENAEAQRFIAKRLVELFRGDPRIDIIALCPNDGGGFCGCPHCRLLDPVASEFGSRYSNRLAPFNNVVSRLVGERCPGKLLKTGAYAMYMAYPTLPGYRPEPNMAVQACHTYCCNNHPITSDCPRNRTMFRDWLEQWAATSKHLWIYEYYNKGAWANLLYTQTHVMRQDIPYYRSIGAESFFTQWSAGSWAYLGLNYYVAARLAWDTEADVDAIMEDACLAFFDKGGPAMVAFYKQLERAFVQSGDCISPFGYKRVWLAAPQVFTPEVLARLETHLGAAERLAPPAAKKYRLGPIRRSFEYTKRTMHYLREVASCFDGVDSPDSPGFAAAEARAREVGERLSGEVAAYLRDNGLGGYLKSTRSKIVQLLGVHRNPRSVVGRWWQRGSSQGPARAALPPIPGSRLVGSVAETARVRLDPQDQGVTERWFAVDLDDAGWAEAPFPRYWQDAGLAKKGYAGYGWYRVFLEAPGPPVPPGMRLMLRFEGVDAAAWIHLNGKLAGRHRYVAGRSWQTPFEVDVTAHIRPGKNLLAIRVYTGGGKGGVYGRVVLYRLGDEPEDFMR